MKNFKPIPSMSFKCSELNSILSGLYLLKVVLNKKIVVKTKTIEITNTSQKFKELFQRKNQRVVEFSQRARAKAQHQSRNKKHERA